MVAARIAKKLRLQIKEAEIVAFGRKNRVLSTILPNVRVGPIRAETVLAGIGDLSFFGPNVDAIIGLDVLTAQQFQHRL